MGLLKHLLFWPITGPTFLTEFSLRKIEGVVREELTDDAAVKEELLALQMELELGDISDETYAQREAELMKRLREVREWREEFGMGTSGGPVQVARDEASATPPNGSVEGGPVGPPRGASSAEGARVELDWDENES